MIGLLGDVVTTINAYEYGRGILLAHGLRQYIYKMQDGIDRALRMHVQDSLTKIIGDTATALTDISKDSDERAASHRYGVILPDAITEVAQSSLKTDVLIPWFLPEIENVVGKVRRGNLVGFMSDSGGGKTSLALSQCRHAAAAGFKTAFLSIEITEKEAALQAAAQAARVPLSRLDDWTARHYPHGRLPALRHPNGHRGQGEVEGARFRRD